MLYFVWGIDKISHKEIFYLVLVQEEISQMDVGTIIRAKV
jgi:hypothetical protein